MAANDYPSHFRTVDTRRLLYITEAPNDYEVAAVEAAASELARRTIAPKEIAAVKAELHRRAEAAAATRDRTASVDRAAQRAKRELNAFMLPNDATARSLRYRRRAILVLLAIWAAWGLYGVFGHIAFESGYGVDVIWIAPALANVLMLAITGVLF